MTTNQKASAKASALRSRISRGKPISQAERQWLDEYSRRVKRGRPTGALPPLPSVGPTESVASEQPDIDTLPPLIVGAPPTEQATAEVIDGEPMEAPTTSANPSPTDGAKRLAAHYCAVVVKLAAWCESHGGIGLSASDIDTFIRPSAERCVQRAMVAMGANDTTDERMDDITTVGSALVFAAQAYYLHSKNKRADTPPASSPQSNASPSNGASARKPVSTMIPFAGGKWKLGGALE